MKSPPGELAVLLELFPKTKVVKSRHHEKQPAPATLVGRRRTRTGRQKQVHKSSADFT